MLQFVNTHQKLLISTILVCIGLFFRLYNYQGYSFGFDQVQILENAQAIKSGNLTLIGPRTGPAAMFTGPLIYYVAAFSLQLVNHPYSLVITNAVILTTTALTLAFLGQRYLKNNGLIASFVPLSLWATSPFLINLDRTVWNPNFSLLSAPLFFFPLLKRTKLNFTDAFIITTGSFLSYQAHFTLLLMPLIALPILLLRSSSKLFITISILVGYFLTLTPTVIFDIRNRWLNSYGLINLLNSQTETSRSLFFSFLDTTRITLETFGKLMSHYHGSVASIFLALILIITAYITNLNNKNSFLRNSVIWLLATIFIFSIYQNSKPEYYFLVIIPACFTLCASLISHLSITRSLILLMFSIIVIQIAISWEKINERTALSIGNTLSIIDHLALQNKTEPISVDVNMLFGTHYGIEYLLKQTPFPHSNKRIHLYYPDPPPGAYTEINGMYLVTTFL